MHAQSRAHRKPPDVEEALSSMLWTPYDNNLSESDSSDETEVLQRGNGNHSGYSFFGTGANPDHRRQTPQHQQQSLMRRSLSAWSYGAAWRTSRTTGGKPAAPGDGEALGSRFSYPYYDQPELGFGAFDGADCSRSSYSFLPPPRVDERPASTAPWQTLTVAGAADGRSNIEKRRRPTYLQLQTPFVGRWQAGVGPAQLETSSLPYSLLALDSHGGGGVGGTTAAATAAAREVDGFADSYQDDYQVYADNNGNGERVTAAAAAAPDSSNMNSINNNTERTCSSNRSPPNDSLCIISAMLRRTSTTTTVTGDGGTPGGDLHLPSTEPRWKGTTATTVGQHNSTIATPLLPLQHAGCGGIGALAAPLSRTPAQRALEGEAAAVPFESGPPVACAVSAFNCVRQANAATSTSVRRADGAQADRVRSSEIDRVVTEQQQQVVVVHSGEGSGDGDRPEQLSVAMRLNVPAAGLAEGGSRTSVYIPAEGEGPPAAGVSLPALTIQVNRLDPNNQQQNDVVNNAASGVSIVSCYRAAPVASGPQEPVECGGGQGAAEQQCSVVVRPEPAAGSEQQGGSVNTSEAAVEPMVQVSSVDRSIESPGAGRNGASDPAVAAEPLVTTLLGPPGSEFSTREHRRRERRERRQARNRLQHIHPLEPPVPPAPLHRSPPPIEIIPDILHSHLPPPYTTLPMGASLLPQMIPANAVAAAAAAAAAIPVRAADDCRYTFPIPIMRSSPSERSRKGCCGHWFAGPPLRALIAVVALGGVACALGGAALGATGLAGSPTSHLTAALLMIGVGVILVTVSGAAWRMTAPGAPPCLGLGSTVDLGRCSRRPCGRGGSTPHGLLYPEFQHRPPPPSYQASMQEYRLRLLLLDRDRQSGRMRSTASPPPTYRSNVGSLLRIPLSSRYNNGSSNSIFGGISGIISGAVGGGSSNSVNNVAAPPAVPSGDLLQVSSSPNPYGAADGHSTLPPSYRSVHPNHEPPQQQPSRQAPTLPAVSTSDAHPGLISDANTTQPTGGPLLRTTTTTTTGVNHHHAPSIIKIDDRCAPTTTTMPDKRNSIPGSVVALIDTVGSSSSEEKVALSAVHNAGTKECDVTPPGTVLAGNNVAKDLVTIVTISGTIEPSGRSVYTSNSNSSNPLAGASGGATCTLLNSNSTPLLATVIPVSKSATATASSPSEAAAPAAVVGGSEAPL
ncbi:AGAP007005-PA [Anopheles gambiae str. PEST]|uniref:AGAP007005-PA n=1 Tax=Anopheles gambiae TaxID=7165 RepID=A7URT5_ANOGA|nr:AGAP007005-PA [Anopheles gambiae str. PEST]